VGFSRVQITHSHGINIFFLSYYSKAYLSYLWRLVFLLYRFYFNMLNISVFSKLKVLLFFFCRSEYLIRMQGEVSWLCNEQAVLHLSQTLLHANNKLFGKL